MNKKDVEKAYLSIIKRLEIAFKSSQKSNCYNPPINNQAINNINERLEVTISQLKCDLKQLQKDDLSLNELYDLKDRVQLLSASFGQSFALNINRLIREDKTNINQLKLHLDKRMVSFYKGFIRPLSSQLTQLTTELDGFIKEVTPPTP